MGLVVAVLVGGLVQGATGLGFTLVAAPLLAVALPANEVVGTVARVAVAVDLALLAADGSAIDVAGLRRYGPAAALAVVPGLVAVAVAPTDLLLGVGAAVAVVGGTLLVALRGAERRDRAFLTAGAGALAGFLGVTTGLSGPPVAVHSAWAGRPARSHRATLAVLFLALDAVAAVAHPRTIGIGVTAVLALAALAGLVIGRAAGENASAAVRRRAVGVVAVVSGLVALSFR